MKYPHPIIAREGWPCLALSLIAALAVHYFAGQWAAFPLWVIFLFILQFFRDPPRTPSSTDANAVLSPADGRIVVVEQTNDPYRNVPALKISVFMNVFNAHSQRSPASGTVEFIRYYPGTFLNAVLSKASLENERNAVIMKLDTGEQISVVQVAGLIARRIRACDKSGVPVNHRYPALSCRTSRTITSDASAQPSDHQREPVLQRRDPPRCDTSALHSELSPVHH